MNVLQNLLAINASYLGINVYNGEYWYEKIYLSLGNDDSPVSDSDTGVKSLLKKVEVIVPNGSQKHRNSSINMWTMDYCDVLYGFEGEVKEMALTIKAFFFNHQTKQVEITEKLIWRVVAPFKPDKIPFILAKNEKLNFDRDNGSLIYAVNPPDINLNLLINPSWTGAPSVWNTTPLANTSNYYSQSFPSNQIVEVDGVKRLKRVGSTGSDKPVRCNQVTEQYTGIDEQGRVYEELVFPANGFSGQLMIVQGSAISYTDFTKPTTGQPVKIRFYLT